MESFRFLSASAIPRKENPLMKRIILISRHLFSRFSVKQTHCGNNDRLLALVNTTLTKPTKCKLIKCVDNIFFIVVIL